MHQFEVTRKTWVFSMCVANVDCQVLFASEYFVTEIARRFNLLMDGPVVVTQSFLAMNCLPHMLQT